MDYDPLYITAKRAAQNPWCPSWEAVAEMAALMEIEPPSKYDEAAVQRLAISVKRKLEPTLDPMLV